MIGNHFIELWAGPTFVARDPVLESVFVMPPSSFHGSRLQTTVSASEYGTSKPMRDISLWRETLKFSWIFSFLTETGP